MLRIILALVAVVVLSLPVVGWWVAQSSLPKVDGIAQVSLLLKEASIISDDRGVPYISASSEPDLYRAQGYWTASQRLFQMDMMRRIARGELSQAYGSHCLPHDKLMRQIGFSRIAAEEMKLLSKEAKLALQSYTEGVNTAISDQEGRRPLEFWFVGYYPSKWQPEDSLAVMKYLQYLQEESWGLDDLRQRVLDKVGPEVASALFEDNFPAPAVKNVGVNGANLGAMPIVDPLAGLPEIVRRKVQALPGLGSNGWAIAGGSTDTGGSLLALDRHSQFVEPNLWYVCSLATGDFKVSGITIPGVPGIMYGRNRSIAWGGTAYKADCQDLFIEQFSPQFPNKYKTPDGWAAAREIVEEIPCKSAFQMQRFQHKVKVTRHGPILLESGSTGVALAWTGNDITTPQFETYYHLNRASNWQQFRDVLKTYHGAAETFLFADKDGNIGMQIAGNIPERKTSEYSETLKASRLLPGMTGESDWTGRVDFAQMPVNFNPKEGFVVANAVNLKDYGAPVTPYPVQRIQSVITTYKQGNRHPGLPDMADLQGDEYAPLQVLVKNTLRDNINKQEVIDQFQLPALQLLEKWDGYLRKQSASAAIYESFVRTIARRMVYNKLGSQLAQEYFRRWPRWSVQVERMLTQKEQQWLPSEERTFGTFVITSFSNAIKDIRPKGGTADDLAQLSWDKFHKATFRNILFEGQPDWEPTIGKVLNIGPEGVSGDGDTVNACDVDLNGKPGEFPARLGPTARVLIDMSDADKFFETQPLGESGHFLSVNRGDQLKSWNQVEPLAVPFSDEQAARQQRHKIILTPESTN